MFDVLGEPTLDDGARISVQRARRRLLYSQWESDAIERMYARLGNVRRDAVGYPDLTGNPFRSICHQVAVLYDREPRISHPVDGAGRPMAAFLGKMLTRAQWTGKAQRLQRDTIGIREMLLRPDVNSEGEIVLRLVWPDRVDARPEPDEPDCPGWIREARPRRLGPEAQIEWTYDVIDPAEQTFRVFNRDHRDVTVDALGAPASGKAYPYVYTSGEPYVPHVLYHATPIGALWDPYELRELQEATYESCVLWSFWSHCVRDASWPQRWAVDLTVQGANNEGEVDRPRQSVITDPATLLMLTRANPDGGSPTPPGQFAPGSDPLALAEALTLYEQRIASYAGVTDPDFIRRSGDPRSGYALAISRDGQRAAARKFEPQFRAGDEGLLKRCAALLNRHAREVGFPPEASYVELPEDGWTIRYPGLPLTPEEQDARRRNVLELLDKGLMSRERAYAELHELSVEEAQAELAGIPDPRAAAPASPPPVAPRDPPGDASTGDAGMSNGG